MLSRLHCEREDECGLVIHIFMVVAAKRSVVKRTGVLIRTTAYFMFLPLARQFVQHKHYFLSNDCSVSIVISVVVGGSTYEVGGWQFI